MVVRDNIVAIENENKKTLRKKYRLKMKKLKYANRRLVVFADKDNTTSTITNSVTSNNAAIVSDLMEKALKQDPLLEGDNLMIAITLMF